MQTIINALKAPHVAPTMKGSALILSSWVLDIMNVNNGGVPEGMSLVLYVLSFVLTCLGIYDFWLKIKWKHRKEREEREREERECAELEAGLSDRARKQTHNDDGGRY
jgi:hypothetical protein